MNQKVELKLLVNGLEWPHYQGKKAWSANTLTKILKEIEYKEIPEHILLKAAERGKSFHTIVQEFFHHGTYPSFVDQTETVNLSKLDGKVHGELLATYIDLEFQDFIIELKSSNFRANESPLALLIFEIQLLLQYLCTGKDIYLLWSTGQGIVFTKFQTSNSLLKILDTLIDLVRNENNYSPSEKKTIIQEIIGDYSPIKLMISNNIKVINSHD
jgi:hypothetical protein